jgi:hypothetical protein
MGEVVGLVGAGQRWWKLSFGRRTNPAASAETRGGLLVPALAQAVLDGVFACSKCNSICEITRQREKSLVTRRTARARMCRLRPLPKFIDSVKNTAVQCTALRHGGIYEKVVHPSCVRVCRHACAERACCRQVQAFCPLRRRPCNREDL